MDLFTSTSNTQLLVYFSLHWGDSQVLALDSFQYPFCFTWMHAFTLPCLILQTPAKLASTNGILLLIIPWWLDVVDVGSSGCLPVPARLTSPPSALLAVHSRPKRAPLHGMDLCNNTSAMWHSLRKLQLSLSHPLRIQSQGVDRCQSSDIQPVSYLWHLFFIIAQ